MRVLLVEPNSRHATVVSTALQAEGVRVDMAINGHDALYVLRDFPFDLVLLNLALPDMDGAALIATIRSAKHDVPIIALSSVPHARLKALGNGADDAVECDISLAELSARIRAIVRRSRGFSHSKLQVGSLVLDVDQGNVFANGTRVHLTNKEFAVLQLLMLRRNMVMTKETILSQLYGGMDEPEIKIVDVFVCKIRSKLAKAGLPRAITTVWGRGYAVKDDGPKVPTDTPERRPSQLEPVFA